MVTLREAPAVEQIVLPGSDGIRLVADWLGDPEAPLVLLCHGGGQTRRSWRATQTRLAAAGYRAVSLDLRGHGESGWSSAGSYELPNFAADLACVVTALGDAAPVLVGASLGGIASLQAVGGGLIPQARGIVLADVVHRTRRDGAKRIGGFMRDGKAGFASLEEAAEAISDYRPERPRPSSPDGLRHYLRQTSDGRWHWHWDPRILSAEGRPPAEYDALTAAVRRVEVPVLLVRGGRSEIVSDELAAEFLALCPVACEVVIADAGHMVAGDDNDAFTAATLDFVKTLHGRSEKPTP